MQDLLPEELDALADDIRTMNREAKKGARRGG